MLKLRSFSCFLFLSFLFFLSLPSSLGKDSALIVSNKVIDAPLLTSKIVTNRTIKVGPKDKHKSIQSGIDAVPKGNSDWIIVHVRAGIYRQDIFLFSYDMFDFVCAYNA